MADTRLTREDLQAVKRYVAYTYITGCILITIWASNSTRLILDKETYESVKMIVRVITYGGLAGAFLGTSSGAAGLNIADKLRSLKNNPRGGQLRRRLAGRNIADIVFIAVSALCTYLLRSGTGPTGIITGVYIGCYIAALAINLLLCKKALNSIDRMDI